MLILPRSKHILQRTLLLFQLFCEVFSQWQESADSLVDFDVQFPRKSYVWFKFRLMEAEEMKRIFSAILQKGVLKIVQAKGQRANEPNLHVGLPNLHAAVENGADALEDLNYLDWFTVKVLSWRKPHCELARSRVAILLYYKYPFFFYLFFHHQGCHPFQL